MTTLPIPHPVGDDNLVNPENLFQEVARDNDGTPPGSVPVFSIIPSFPDVPGRSRTLRASQTRPPRPRIQRQKPQPREGQPPVVTGTGQQCIHPIPLPSLTPVPPQMTIRLQVADHHLNRLPPQALLQPPGHDTSPLPGQAHRSLAFQAPVTAVYEHLLNRLTSQAPRLVQRPL